MTDQISIYHVQELIVTGKKLVCGENDRVIINFSPDKLKEKRKLYVMHHKSNVFDGRISKTKIIIGSNVSIQADGLKFVFDRVRNEVNVEALKNIYLATGSTIVYADGFQDRNTDVKVAVPVTQPKANMRRSSEPLPDKLSMIEQVRKPTPDQHGNQLVLQPTSAIKSADRITIPFPKVSSSQVGS
jgi:hypothetical protein